MPDLFYGVCLKLILNQDLDWGLFYVCPCVNDTLCHNLKCLVCFTGFIFHVPLLASSILHAGHISTLRTVATSNYFIYILCNYHEIFLLRIWVPAKTGSHNIASSGPTFWWEHCGIAWWALVSTFLSLPCREQLHWNAYDGRLFCHTLFVWHHCPFHRHHHHF